MLVDHALRAQPGVRAQACCSRRRSRSRTAGLRLGLAVTAACAGLELLSRGGTPSLAAVRDAGPIEVLPALDRQLAVLGRPSSALSFPAGFGRGALGACLSGGSMLLAETALLLALELLPGLTSPFAARKICHAGTGLLILLVDTREASARAAMWLIGVGSILMTWNVTRIVGIRPFRFGAERDLGITVYLCIVMAWFYAELPTAALSPMFFADPSGAVVGKYLTRMGFKNPAWYQKKTLGGSAAVLLVTVMTLLAFYPPMPAASLAALSVAAVVAEALGGQFDNLCLAAVVIGGYRCLAAAA